MAWSGGQICLQNFLPHTEVKSQYNANSIPSFICCLKPPSSQNKNCNFFLQITINIICNIILANEPVHKIILFASHMVSWSSQLYPACSYLINLARIDISFIGYPHVVYQKLLWFHGSISPACLQVPEGMNARFQETEKKTYFLKADLLGREQHSWVLSQKKVLGPE